MYKRASIYASFFLILGLLGSPVSFGASRDLEASLNLKTEGVGLLPISPLYFLKEVKRDLMRFFTKDPVSEAMLELRIVNEKAAELKKIQEFKPNDVPDIAKAMENYKSSQIRLSSKLKEIEELPSGRASTKLIEELASKAILHEQFLRSFEKEYENRGEIKNLADGAKKELEETTRVISQTVPAEKLVPAMRKTIVSTTTPKIADEMKQEAIQAVILNLEEGAPEESKGTFAELKNEFSFSTSTTSTPAFATATSTPISTSTPPFISTSTVETTSTLIVPNVSP